MYIVKEPGAQVRATVADTLTDLLKDTWHHRVTANGKITTKLHYIDY